MSSKENVAPVHGRKSKLPVPRLPFASATKGKKRAVSPSAGSSDCKRSPSHSKRTLVKSQEGTSSNNGRQRKMLGELPCEQRKIVKVRRHMNADTVDEKKSLKKSTTKVKTQCAKPKGDVVATRRHFGMNRGQLPDQSGIVFEKDDSALQSILDESGIQFGCGQSKNQPAQPKVTRHTLASSTVTKPQGEPTTPSRIKSCVDNFRKMCDDFIARATNKQPNPKRQRVGSHFKDGEDLNLKLTPSKTDFCSKFGVEKSVTFKGVSPGSAARQSLPGRTRVQSVNPFLMPGRSSMAAQPPRRLETVGEEPRGLGSIGRHSLTVQTPQRVLKKIKDVDQQPGEETDRLSLCPQIPGRVSLFAQTPSRQSMAPDSENRLSFFSRAQAPLSSVPQTVGRVSVGRMSISCQPPGRVSLSAQKPSRDLNSDVQGRPSLAPQTPGRVSLSAQRLSQNPVQGRVSITDQTPRRVKITKPSCSDDIDTDNIKFENLCQNLQGKFLMQSPGRVLKNERTENKENKDGENKDLPIENKENDPMDNVEKTSTKAKALSCGTPVRVKQLQTEEQTPKFSPQRILKPVLTPQHTPRRVPMCQTPKQNAGTPQGPIRLPLKVMTPGTPSRVLITSNQKTDVTSSQKTDGVAGQKMDLEANQNAVFEPDQKTSQENTNKKQNKKETLGKKLGDNGDLRSYWKTKKTPQKSPILKEVLTEESTDTAMTPKTHIETVVTTIKRKKTLTWAAALESCQSPDSNGKLENEKWKPQPQDAKTLSSHDAMQDNPHKEKITYSPTKENNQTSLTDTQNSLDNMQLPVCLTGSSSAYQSGTTGSIDIENKSTNDDLCTKADDTLVSHRPNFAQLDIDSLSVSQQELGQHHSNVLANATQNEFLQKQIEEKKRQLAQLQIQIEQHLLKTTESNSNASQIKLDNAVHSDNGNVPLCGQSVESHAETEGQNVTEPIGLDNLNLSKHLDFTNLDIQYAGKTSTQGTYVGEQVNLDLNSNVTGPGNSGTLGVRHGVPRATSNQEKQPSPESTQMHGAVTVSGIQEAHIFCTLSPERTRSPVDEDITPFIRTDVSQTLRDVESNKRTLELDEELGDVSSLFGEKQTLNKDELLNVPLWTPLAMKTVAKQQSVEKIHEEQEALQKIKSESKPKIDNVAKSDIDTKVTNTGNVNIEKSFGLVPNENFNIVEENKTVSEQHPKTPQNKKSAFRRIAGTGLSPVVGSLSLRANTSVICDREGKCPPHSLHNSVLRAANERYQEALLDDEVALFLCRLSPGRSIGKGRELCHDPVAKMLLHGDELHFIPIEMESTSETASVHIEGSAFTKYAERAT